MNNIQEFQGYDDYTLRRRRGRSLRKTAGDGNDLDYYWEKLSEGGDEKAQLCGWLKDKYGVSWQILPAVLGELLIAPDPDKPRRVMKALLGMKKIDLERLKQASGR